MKIVLLVSSLVMENDLSAIFDVKCRQKLTVRRRILVHRWEYSETSRKKMILIAWYDEPLQSDGSMDSKYKFHPNFVGQPFIPARENKIDYAYMRKNDIMEGRVAIQLSYRFDTTATSDFFLLRRSTRNCGWIGDFPRNWFLSGRHVPN